MIRASNRSNVIVWYGALGALQLDLIANLGVGWVCGLTNEGTDSVTLVGSAGQTINGGAILTVEPGSSGLIFCSASGFNTIGVLVTVIPIVSGGTGATTAAGALTNLGGTAVGQSIFTAPSAASVIALLGLNNFTFKESSISASQSLAAGSSNTGFVCTAPLTLSLPLTTTLTNTFIFAAYAQGGAVTVVPQASDQINNQTAGANLVLPQGTSAMFFTDADGNWWPFFVSTQNVPGSWAIAGGTADVITAAYSPANTALTDGLLLGFRASAANVTTTPTLNPDGLGAATITDLGGNPVNVGAIPAQYAEMLVRYNLANTRWELLNPSPVLTRWAVAGGTVNAITVSPTPVLPALLDGALVWFRASGANTIAAPTLSVSGLAAHPITNLGGAALLPGAIPAQYAEMIVRYNMANTRWELLNPAVTTANQQTQGAISGLKVNVSSGTTVAVAATSVSVGNGSGSYYQATAVSVSINSAVNGANGLDTGALGASTWYAVFAIYNPATATVAGLMSLSGTAPTLPSGYTFFARVGWVLTNSGSALIGTLQYGRRAQYVVGGTNLTALPVMITAASGSVDDVPTWVGRRRGGVRPIPRRLHQAALIRTVDDHQWLAAPNNSYGAAGSSTNPPPGYRRGTAGIGAPSNPRGISSWKVRTSITRRCWRDGVDSCLGWRTTSDDRETVCSRFPTGHPARRDALRCQEVSGRPVVSLAAWPSPQNGWLPADHGRPLRAAAAHLLLVQRRADHRSHRDDERHPAGHL